MDLGLKDRVAVVTGGSSGIGLETVRRFLEEGAYVLSCARGSEALARSAEKLSSEGFGKERLVTQVCDVLDAKALEMLAETARTRFARADILVNNAGQGRIGTFESTLDADWENELALKIFGVVRPIRAFLPLLKQSDAAAIVVVNSLLAHQPEPHMVCTSAARSSLQNLVKSLSIELAPTIRVNSILLGTINSGQWERRHAERGATGQTLQQWLDVLAHEKKIPLGRMGRADEPAAAIAFLSSTVSGFTTGSSLEISGGMSRFA